MTIRLVKMALRAFELNTPEIPDVGFGRIRGSKPHIGGAMAAPSYTIDEVGPVTTDNSRTRRVNPSMVGETFPFPESDDPESTGISMISLMTIEEEGAEVTWPRRFSKYSSQSFLNPTDIALQLVPDWAIGGNKLAAIQSPLRTISLSI